MSWTLFLQLMILGTWIPVLTITAIGNEKRK